MRRKTLRKVTSAVTGTALIATVLAYSPLAAGAAGLDGATATAGSNSSQQLGRSTLTAPADRLGVISPRLDRIVAMDGGAQHSLSIDRDGIMKTWGSNSDGQLGRTTALSAPASSPGGSIAVSDADAGDLHTAWADPAGFAYVAGSNSHGQQGALVGSGGATPNQVQYRLALNSPLAPLSNVSAVAAGAKASYFVNNDGVWAIGDNRRGQLGNGLSGSFFNPIATQVADLPAGIVDVAAGDGFAAALAANGDVWTWGDNSVGQLGRTTSGSTTPTARKIPSLTGIDLLVAGDRHLVAADLDTGQIHGFGDNALGQLGSSDAAARTNVVTLSDLVMVAAGGRHTLAVTAGDVVGRVHSWGSNAAGQLARSGASTSPATIAGVEDAVAIGAGGQHTLVARAPSVRLDPTTFDFGTIEVGTTSASATFTLTNLGPGRVDLTGASSSNPAEFPITSSTCTAGATLAESATCSVTVEFSPTAFGVRGSGNGPAVLTVGSKSNTGTVKATLAGVGSIAAGDLTLSVDPPLVAAGPDRVPTDLIPLSADSPDVDAADNAPDLAVKSAGIDELKLSPRSVGIDALKLSVKSAGIDELKLSPRSVGIDALKLSVKSAGIDELKLSPRSVGIDALKLSSYGNAVLDSISLAQMPLATPSFDAADHPNWYDLVAARYPNDPIVRPLNEVSVSEAMDRWPLVFDNLSARQVDLASSPLGGITLIGLFMGDLPIIALPEVAADPAAACAHLEAGGFANCGAELAMARPGGELPAGYAGLTASLLMLDLARIDTAGLVDLDSLTVDAIAAHLSGSDAQDGYDHHAVIDGTSYPLVYSGAGLVEIPTAFVSWNQTSLGKIEARQLDASIRCDLFDCGAPAYADDLTLAQAAAFDALAPGGKLGTLLASGLGDTLLAEAVLASLLTGDRPAVSLDALVERGLAARGETLDPATYTAVWTNKDSVDLTGAELTIDMHQSMWPLGSTATATPGVIDLAGQFQATGDPVSVSPTASRGVDRRIAVTFGDLNIPADGAMAVSIDALAGPREGTVSAVAIGATPAAPASAPDPANPVILAIAANHEPNDTPAEATLLQPRDDDADIVGLDRLPGEISVGGGDTIINQLSHGGEIDWFAISATNSDGSPIEILEITNHSKDGVQVAALYYPEGVELEAPLRNPGPNGVARYDHVRELGMSVTKSEQPFEADTPPALPGEELGLHLADFSATANLASDILIAAVPPTVQPGDHFLLALEAAPDADIHSSVSMISARALSKHSADIPSSRDLDAECAVALDRSAPPAFGWPADLGGAETIYLLDSVALAADDPAGLADLAVSFDALAAHSSLNSFVVADIAANPVLNDAIATRAADPCDVADVNALVRAINDELDALGRDASTSVSILGGTDGVPMGFAVDVAPMSAGNELTYAASLAVEGGAADLVSGYAAGRYPTDSAYAASTVLGLRGTYYYPRDLRTARQLGDAAAIADAIDALVAADGSYTLTTGTAQSTDWMTTFGESVSTDLAEAGLSVSGTEHGNDVTTADILASLGSADAHVGGLHGMATGLFDSAENVVDPAALAAAIADSGLDLVMGPYCHAGAPVAGGVAAALGSDDTVSTVLNTTYGMGIEDGVVLTTRVLAKAVQLIDEVANPVDLLNRALAEAFLEDLEWSIFAVKADMGITPYGLTAWTNTLVAPSEPQPVVGDIVTDPFTGLESYTVNVDLASDRVETTTDFGTYWSIAGETVSRSGGPLQPSYSLPVPANATGVFWTGGAVTHVPGTDLVHQTNQLSASPINAVEVDSTGLQGPTAAIRRHGQRTALSLRAGFATDMAYSGGKVIGDEHLLDEASFEIFVGDPATALQAKPDLIEAVRTSPTTVGFEVEFIDDAIPANDPLRVVVTISESPGSISFVELAELSPVGDGRTRFAGIAPVGLETDVLAFIQTVSATQATYAAPPVKVLDERPGIGYVFSVVDSLGNPLAPTATGAYVDPFVKLTADSPSDLLEFSIADGPFQPYIGMFPLDGPDRLVPIRVRVTDHPATEGHHWVLKEGELDQIGPDVEIVAPLDGSTAILNANQNAAIACFDANGTDQLTVSFRRAGEASPAATYTYSGNGSVLKATPPMLTDQSGAVIVTAQCTNVNGLVSDLVTAAYTVRFAEGTGFDSPIRNLPEINQINAGSTMRVQFSLYDANGNPVGTAQDVRSVGTFQLTDAGGNPCTAGGTNCQEVETRGGSIRQAGDKIVIEVETKKAWKCTKRRLVVLLEDDTSMVADFHFKGSGC